MWLLLLRIGKTLQYLLNSITYSLCVDVYQLSNIIIVLDVYLINFCEVSLHRTYIGLYIYSLLK